MGAAIISSGEPGRSLPPRSRIRTTGVFMNRSILAAATVLLSASVAVSESCNHAGVIVVHCSPSTPAPFIAAGHQQSQGRLSKHGTPSMAAACTQHKQSSSHLWVRIARVRAVTPDLSMAVMATQVCAVQDQQSPALAQVRAIVSLGHLQAPQDSPTL